MQEDNTRSEKDLEMHLNNKALKQTQELPSLIEVPDIKHVIDSGYYVDKTAYAYHLMKKSCAVFLSRPRRFGKSLFVSTLEEIAKGNKELFKDCLIGKYDYAWKKHPIIRFSFAGLNDVSAENLILYIENKLEKIASNYKLLIKGDIWQSKLENLVEDMTKLEGYADQVVFLLDEYDAPFISIQEDGDIKEEQSLKDKNRNVVRNFLTVIKKLSGQRKIHLAFITGVSAYSFKECASGPNNLEDLTLEPDYAAIAGYMKIDLLEEHAAYKQRINHLAKKKNLTPDVLISHIRFMYNGYKFATDDNTVSVYNPWSTLKFLKNGEFGNYWHNSGTPTFLVNKFNNKTYFDLDLSKPITVAKSDLIQPTENQLGTAGEMFQGGYFTIDGWAEKEPSNGMFRTDEDLLRLKFPNNEVETSFYKFLSQEVGKSAALAGKSHKNKITESLSNVDVDSFIKDAKICLCSIPYNLSQQRQNKNEAYYHAALHCFLKGAGVHPRSEDPTNQGRADIVIDSLADTIYIFELKHNATPQVELKQIHDNKYMKKYLGGGKDIVLVGINFSSDGRNITGHLYEIYDTEGNKKYPTCSSNISNA